MYKIESETTYEDDHVIFDEGSEEERVYVVLSGAVKIIKRVHGEEIVVEVMRRGDIFGEMAFVAGMPRTAQARALGRTTVGVLDPAQLQNEFDELSPAMRRIMESLVVRLKKATENSLGVSYIRKQPRVLKTLSVTFDKGHMFLEAASRDASLGGMFVRTDDPLNEGETFFLNLKLPGEKDALKIRCQVAWVRKETRDPDRKPVGMGVKFLRLAKEDHNMLKKILEYAD